MPGLSNLLCGASRPGHFVGVATVVCKLFNMVQPDIALFGEKDFQQLLVIRRMTEDLALPIEVRGVATVREADGLAMSSRNGYLDAGERAIAPALYGTLQALADRVGDGERDYRALQADGVQQLEAAGLRPDYLQFRRADNLGEPSEDTRELVIVAAAYLGTTRLIDNLSLTVNQP